MKLKRLVNFRVDFRRPWAQYSAALMGIFIFLRALWYFLSPSHDGLSSGELCLHLILPLAVGIVYVALLRGVQMDLPIVYGAVGAVFCGLMIALNLQYGAGLWVILTVICYCLGALVLLATVLGFLPNRLYLLGVFALAVIFQYFASGIGSYITHFSLSQLTMLLRETSNLFGAAALAVFSASLIGKKAVNV